jgi:LPXTG-motif cell wall-anchored protein
MEPGDYIRPVVIGIGMILGMGIAFFIVRKRQK